MSDLLYSRAVRVNVDGRLFEGLRVQFRVKKTTAKEPNEAEISIYNLSEQSRSAFQAKGSEILLEAGYSSTVAQIFRGTIQTADHKHEGADWISTLQCSDGVKAYKFTPVVESFAPGTPASKVFAWLANATGLDAREAISTFQGTVSEQFTQGYAAFGQAPRELDRLLKGRGLEWSIQDGRLQVLRAGETTKNTAVLLSADTGLVGSPEHGTPDKEDKPPLRKQRKKPQILKVKSLLQPRINAGGKIRLESEGNKGDYRVDSVVHTGDTHGQDWYSVCDCIPLS